MANPELIEYAKNQLKAGSSANYIRTVLIKQGWGERDVDDALGIAQTESGPQAAAPAKAGTPTVAKPAEGGGKNKFLGIAGLLTGIVFLVSGGIAVYMLLMVGKTLVDMDTMLVSLGATPMGFSNYLIFGWAFAILGLLAGVFWLIAGIKEIKS